MNDVKQWLMKADARKIFFCLLGILLLVTAWWVWKAFAPIEGEVLVPQAAAKEKPFSRLGVVAFLDRESSREVKLPENLFRSGEERRQRRRDVSETTQQPKEPVQQPKPEVVSITYRGMFQRTDGKVLALIEDSKTKRSAFYTSDQQLLGHKISEISEQTVAIVRPDGGKLVLKVGKPQKLE